MEIKFDGTKEEMPRAFMQKLKVRHMTEGVDYNVEPEPIPVQTKETTPSEKRMVSVRTWLDSPEYAARRARRIEHELDNYEGDLYDPEDENRLLGTDNNEPSHE